MFCVVYHPQLELHGFGKRAGVSYGGWPVEQTLVRFFEPQLNGVLLFLLALPLTAILALASWKLVETPFVRLKRRRVLETVTASAATRTRALANARPLCKYLGVCRPWNPCPT